MFHSQKKSHVTSVKSLLGTGKTNSEAVFPAVGIPFFGPFLAIQIFMQFSVSVC